MPDVILHHYWQSPVAEKVRKVLGIKGLDWYSVEIPRIPPKPELMPLTGGYRRTPVMQIGADIYCDSECIIRELQHRYPEPTLYPGGADGMVWGISQWTSQTLFADAVAVVLGHQVDSLPADFAADRIRLYFGPDATPHAIASELTQRLAQIRAQLGWMDQRLLGRDYMLGDTPGLPDALAWYLVWFIRGRYSEGQTFLKEFAGIQAWEKRVDAIGVGQHQALSAQQALMIAQEATTTTPVKSDSLDPQGLTPGLTVDIVPIGDGSDPLVRGEVISVDRETISIGRHDSLVNDVVVHFPRVGYSIAVVD